MTPNQILTRLRKQKNVTQKELSNLSGVDYSTITKIERGAIKNPRMEIIEKLARALNVEAEKFFETQKPVVVRLDDLPLLSLTPEQFETLILMVLQEEPEYFHAEKYGARGDKQRDLIAKREPRNKKSILFQCKRYKKFSLSEMKTEAQEIYKHFFAEGSNPDTPIDELVFCFACEVTPGQRDNLKRHCKELGLPEPILWGKHEVTAMANRHSSVLKTYFGAALYEIKDGVEELKEGMQELHGKVAQLPEKVDAMTKAIKKIAEKSSSVLSPSKEEKDSEIRHIKRLINNRDYIEARTKLLVLKDKLNGKKTKEKDLGLIHYYLGVCFNQTSKYQGDFSKAKEHFEQALDHDPSLDSAKNDLCIVLMNVGDNESLERAYTISKELLAANPEKLEYLCTHLHSLLQTERLDEIPPLLPSKPATLEKTLGNELLAIAIAQSFLVLEKLDEAEAYARKGLEKHPKSHRLKGALGKAIFAKAQLEDVIPERTRPIPRLRRTSRMEEVALLFREAVVLAKEDEQPEQYVEGLRLLCFICTTWIGKYSDSSKISDEILRSALDEHQRLELEKAEFYSSLQRGYLEEGYSKLRDSVLLRKADYQAILIWAGMFFWKGGPEQAIKLLETIRVEAIEKKDASYWFMLSSCFALIDDKASALAAVSEAERTLEPTSEDFKSLLSHKGALAARYGSTEESDRLTETMFKLQDLDPTKKIVEQIPVDLEAKELPPAIIEFFKQASERFEEAKTLVKSKGYPFYLLTDYFKRSLPEVLKLGIGSSDLNFILPFNTLPQGRPLKTDLEQRSVVVLDYSALYNLAKTNNLGLLAGLGKRGAIHRSLVQRMQMDLLSREDGDLRRAWNFVRKSQDSIEIIEDTPDSDFLDIMKGKLEASMLDTLRFAKEKNLLLICDDANFANILRDDGMAVTNTYELFEIGNAKGLLDHKTFALTKANLAEFLYVFIPFSVDEFSTIALDDFLKIERNLLPYFFFKGKHTEGRISVRLMHLLRQAALPGSQVQSFFSVVIQGIRKITSSGAIFEEKLGLLRAISWTYRNLLNDQIVAGDKALEVLFKTFLKIMWEKSLLCFSAEEQVQALEEVQDMAAKNQFFGDLSTFVGEKFKDGKGSPE